MFRASVLSIVMALAIGPDAAMICHAWCVGERQAAVPCHQGSGGSLVVAADVCCDEGVRAAAAVLVGDTKPRASAPNGDPALQALQSQISNLASVIRPDRKIGRQGSIDNRPLATALRI
jgi:hypothetical protein